VATPPEQTTYPKIGAKAWAELRSRAATAPSIKVTPSVVASLLSLKDEASATTNIVRPMRQLGLIEEDGSLTPRGSKWRVEASYADACQEIIDKVYPDELTAITDGSGAPDKSKLTDWFSLSFGKSNARQMAATYAMIAAKTLPEAPSPSATKPTSNGSRRKKSAAAEKSAAQRSGNDASSKSDPPSPPPSLPDPSLQLSIQIHIPADATPEQVDHIFASMAKHLYKR
jgi:hypothetical protein